MSEGGDRSVHSIVCACLRPTAAADGEARRRLREIAGQALASEGVAAERLFEIDEGIAAIFLNTSAALEFARLVLRQSTAEADLPLGVGVHMGSLNAADAQLAGRMPLRAARQIAALAAVGKALASPLFHNFVAQFDHACRSRLLPLAAGDGGGSAASMFEIHFGDDRPPARNSGGPVAGRESSGALPSDPARRQAFLGHAEALLAEQIGPLARLIVKKAAAAATSRAGFCHQLAEALPDPAKRSALVRALIGFDSA